MPKIQNILCPIDFSQSAMNALDYAIELAKVVRADIKLLHVYEDPLASIPFARTGSAGDPTAPIEIIEEARRKRIAEIERLQAMCASHGVQAKVQEIEGTPAQTIVKVAGETGIDLIIMGTHGRTGLSHALVGSVAERVVRQSPCPVLTVRSKA